jgi:hypothetical protein
MSEGESERAVDRLIAIEWDAIHDLERQLEGDLSHEDRVRISNSLAYHVNTLSKLLAGRDEVPAVDEEPLVSVIARFPRRLSRAVKRRLRRWRRSRS